MSEAKRRKSSGGRWGRLIKWLIPVAVVGALVAVALKPKPVDVDVGAVLEGAMRMTVDDDGETRVRERYVLSAPLSGRLRRIALDPGDPVEAGEIVAIIEPAAPDLLDPRSEAKARAAVGAAGAAVKAAEVQLKARGDEAEQLLKAFERNKLLHEKGNVADAALEEVESAYLAAIHAREGAGSSLDVARFEFEQAKAALLRFDGVEGSGTEGSGTEGSGTEGSGSEGSGSEGSGSEGSGSDTGIPWHFEIRAPVTGAVLEVGDKNARAVRAGDALMEIGDPQRLEMRIDVLSQDAVRIKPGQQVIVEHWGGEEALNGRVRTVEPSAYTKVSALGVDEQRVDVIADFAGETPGSVAIADGYRIEARIVIWEKADAIQVPAGALFRQGDRWAAYEVQGDRARLVVLELGQNNGEFAEVLSGLEAGDRVILHPGDRISENSLIRPRP